MGARLGPQRAARPLRSPRHPRCRAAGRGTRRRVRRCGPGRLREEARRGSRRRPGRQGSGPRPAKAGDQIDDLGDGAWGGREALDEDLLDPLRDIASTAGGGFKATAPARPEMRLERGTGDLGDRQRRGARPHGMHAYKACFCVYGNGLFKPISTSPLAGKWSRISVQNPPPLWRETRLSNGFLVWTQKWRKWGPLGQDGIKRDHLNTPRAHLAPRSF
jgi:hypothetical protein